MTMEEVIERNTGMSLKAFLTPQPNPYIHNMDRAVEFFKKKVNDAAEEKEILQIKIVGDYDADGMNASAILYDAIISYLKANSLAEYAEVSVRLPRRYSEGYGLSKKIIDESESGLIITVDNGIAAIDAIKKAKDKGIDVIILDHHLYTGFAGTAGEAGHMIVQPGGRSCPCGNHGCLEQYISEPAVLSRYQELSGRTTVSIDDLVWSYNQKEADALAVVDEFTTYLACGINNLWNLFSPECIILNSQLTAYLPQLLPEILQKLSARFRATCQLKLSTLQDTGVLLGAARVCISKYLGIENLSFSGFQP